MNASALPSMAQRFVSENPVVTAGILVGTAAVVAPAVVVSPVLGLVGFGAKGVAANSIACGLQAGIGNVVAPSLFSVAQSAAMGGYGVAAVHGAVQAGGAVVVAGAGVAAWVKSKV